VIIVARGGGSIEDLWAFNEEVVARAIAASKLPVISAVGHEVDVTIADLVADLRAPTPSAAAELVVSSKAQLMADCDALSRRLVQAAERLLADSAAHVAILKLSLKDPETTIERFMQRLDDLEVRAETAVTELLRSGVQRVDAAENRLKLTSPDRVIRAATAQVDNLSLRMSATLCAKVEHSRSALATAAGRLDALSPLAILQRGYAAVCKPVSGTLVKSVTQIREGEPVDVRFADGIAACDVRRIRSCTPL
jgi:exodeoxyribonuclease VII large subunit